MKKRLLSVALIAAMFFSLSVQTFALGSFSDVTDIETARNAEVLKLMGVMEGGGDGRFMPERSLTRAEFCKMVVVLMGAGDSVSRYKTVTIFPDVRSNHWAVGYINYAVRGGTRLIAGLPDGSFAPERTISCGEAVTILMRLLGYTDADSGVIWPDGYMALAEEAGLTKGLSLSGKAEITRAEAAKLFVNALRTAKKGGGNLYALGDETTLISIGGDTMRTTAGESTMAKPAVSTVLCGLKGYVLKNADGKALTFLPAELTATAAPASAAVVIDGSGSQTALAALTGGRTDYEIYKNGNKIGRSALKAYDVATYDAATNTVYVCDTRVTARYEAVSPSPDAAAVVTALGHQFNVLSTARDSVAQFTPGKVVTLLLTHSGDVAAMTSGSQPTGNATGIVTGTKLLMFCGSGIIELACAESEKYEGKLVRITTDYSGNMQLSVQTSRVNGALDAAAGTLGGRKVAIDATIYDDGVLTSLAELGAAKIAAEKISYVRTDDSGEIDLIVLSGSTGETYGVVSTSKTTDETGQSVWQVSVSNPSGKLGPYVNMHSVYAGAFVAAKVSPYSENFFSLNVLTELPNVSRSAWIGTGAVNYGGTTYAIDKDVLCYNQSSDTWFASLDEALAYGGTMNLHEKDGIIHIVEVLG